jgi:DNA-binding transcriptional LysR family regulator
MDKFRALQIFRRVVELNGFSAAARDLDLSNAGVSKTVSALEAELGAQLLVRTTRKLRLTDTGQTYYDRAVQILEALEEADHAASRAEAAPRGRLRISAPMSFGLTDLAARLPRFQDRYPDISLDIDFNDRHADLLEGGFDIALRGSGPLPDSSLKARRLRPIDRILCASGAYLARHGRPDRPEALADHNCLIYTLAARPDVWSFRRGSETQEVSVSGTYRANSSIALGIAAISGNGLALLPDFVAGPDIRAGRLVTVLTDWQTEPQHIHAVYPSHRETSPKVRALIDFLVADYAGDQALTSKA